MRATILPAVWERALRLLALGVATAVLGGCATGYSLVQADGTGGGAYYSGEAYTGTGYYDAGATGPYYAGTAGWGYYDGIWPYTGAGGWYGSGFGFGYDPPFALGFGFSSVWNFPGYWGPWYATGAPVWSCRWQCRQRRAHYYGHPRMGRGGWRHDGGYGSHAPIGGDYRARVEANAQSGMMRMPRAAAGFAARDFVHAPMRPWTARAGMDMPRPAAPTWRGRPAMGAFARDSQYGAARAYAPMPRGLQIAAPVVRTAGPARGTYSRGEAR
ncbi:MAG TPA: hypothetical protein VFQ95_09520 [Rhodanobacteraceae bacterium]|nr:hypothetical protein [Rhodanobacteraceae bacterium]